MAAKDSLDAGDPRIFFAAERTLLAWVRTGLTMMGFGFVVARFGVFLREIAALNATANTATGPGISLWFGVAFVVLGILANLYGAAAHWRTIRRLRSETPLVFPAFSFASGVALLLGLIGLCLTAYLLTSVQRR